VPEQVASFRSEAWSCRWARRAAMNRPRGEGADPSRPCVMLGHVGIGVENPPLPRSRSAAGRSLHIGAASEKEKEGPDLSKVIEDANVIFSF